ncbi:MAG: metallophosphoesterase [Lachnospiraceae bacterium]|nr:metallophosphoesterase [Lachnospiraceae bacterium]
MLIACDMRLKTVVYIIESDKVSNTVTFALITDLHSDKYGKGQKTLLNAVDEQSPDIVLLGGDIFDDEKSYDNAETTIKYLAEKYPCYYVTGNHEYWSKDIDNILDIVESYGAVVLSGDCDTITINGESINICGVDDPAVVKYTKHGKGIERQMKESLKGVDTENYTILLSHRPELIDTYKEYDFDLVLSGHAHGGQWRIPGLINGIYVPNQGLFPQYAGGRYDYDTGTLIVSRGLARESTPIPRVFNRPELVIVKVK